MDGIRTSKMGNFTWLTLSLGLAACAGTTETGSDVLSLEGDALGAPPEQGPPRAPPPEAFEACEDKAVGDACTITLRDLELTGECVAPPEGAPDDRLACRPDQPPPPPPDGDGNGDGRQPPPPPPDGDGNGDGRQPPPPPPDGDGPQGPPPPEAFEACEGLDAGAACTVAVDGHEPVDGTCLPPPWDAEGPLACVPANMLPPG